MIFVFDHAKDAINRAKHHLSLADVAGFDIVASIEVDGRFDYGEVRYRGFGRIDGVGYSIAFTRIADGFRLISFRRARERRCAVMSKGPPPEDYDDNPEWTAEDFARARPAHEVFPRELVALLVRKPGRPAGTTKEQVSLRIDRDVLTRFRADGTGWQSRMNAALRKAAGL